jgi:hypothetical protein
MTAGVVSRFDKPGARSHEGSRADQVVLEQSNSRGIHGVAHAKVISVDDEVFHRSPQDSLILKSILTVF